MKKYFLKGKAYIHQKMGQFDIEHDKLDLVTQQTPKKHQETFRILSSQDIDLESFEKYSPYYRTYPNHPIAPLLLDKIMHQTNIMEPSYIEQIRIQKNKVPIIDEDLEEKAYILRNIVEGYSEGSAEMTPPLLAIGVVQFHHKRGAETQFVHPSTQSTLSLFNSVIPFAMPDSSHNKMQDCSFFNLMMPVNGEQRMVYGISYFKQVKVTEEMRKENPELTRSHLQKSICILCFVPLFGEYRLKVMGIAEKYFSNLSDFSVISGLYEEIKGGYEESWEGVGLKELHVGIDALALLGKFKTGLLGIFKAVLYNKRVIVYSQSAYSSSSGILSILSLFPGQLVFNLRSTILDKYMEGLRQYALPLKLLSTQQPLFLCANIQIMSKLKQLTSGYLIGTSNQMLIQSLNYQLLIDLDKNQLRYSKQHQDQQPLSKQDRVLLGILDKILKGPPSSAQRSIADTFHNYLKTSLCRISDIRYRYNQFVASCRLFEEDIDSRKGVKSEGHKNYQRFEEENEIVMKVPQFNQGWVEIPLVGMVGKPYFRYFLEFSNPQLYLLTGEYLTENFLVIDNFEYYLGSIPQFTSKYTTYNYKTKKLRICNLESSEKNKIKELKFKDNIVMEVFIGDSDGFAANYTGHGVSINADELYEGGFNKGAKHGFGKLVTPTYTYIGTFNEGLYHGDGHLVLTQSNTIYVGMFKQGVKDGFGKLQTPTYYYQGQFSDNSMSGNGSMTILDSKIKYFGTFANDKLLEADSESVIRFPNGDVYTGTTKDMLMHGGGVLHRNEGVVVEGVFEQGVYKGER